MAYQNMNNFYVFILFIIVNCGTLFRDNLTVFTCLVSLKRKKKKKLVSRKRCYINLDSEQAYHRIK